MTERKADALLRLLLVPGICHCCGCTEENACPGGCAWVDNDETLCTTCEEIGIRFMAWHAALVNGGVHLARSLRSLRRRRKKNTP